MCEAFCIGSEVASPEIDSETYAAIQRAIKKAVRLINESKKRYLHYFTSAIPSELGTLKTCGFSSTSPTLCRPGPLPCRRIRKGISVDVESGSDLAKGHLRSGRR